MDCFTAGRFLLDCPIWGLLSSRHWGWGIAAQRIHRSTFVLPPLTQSLLPAASLKERKIKTPNTRQHFRSDLVSYCRFGSFAFLAPSICNCVREKQLTETWIIFPIALQNKIKAEYGLEIQHWVDLSICNLQAVNRKIIVSREEVTQLWWPAVCACLCTQFKMTAEVNEHLLII